MQELMMRKAVDQTSMRDNSIIYFSLQVNHDTMNIILYLETVYAVCSYSYIR